MQIILCVGGNGRDDHDSMSVIEFQNEWESYHDFSNRVLNELGLDHQQPHLFTFQNGLCIQSDTFRSMDGYVKDSFLQDGEMVCVTIPVLGGMDFQHREGGKTGSGGQMSESQAALERKERLRKLALETIDITKDPYFMRNHLGTFECKLCLTLHPNEGNYLAHTQGKRHQYNLGRRAAMEAKNAAPRTIVIKEAPVKRVIKIGRPGYKVRLVDVFEATNR